jgi:hypothetical protein
MSPGRILMTESRQNQQNFVNRQMQVSPSMKQKLQRQYSAQAQLIAEVVALHQVQMSGQFHPFRRTIPTQSIQSSQKNAATMKTEPKA